MAERLQVRVESMTREAANVLSLELASPDGSSLPSFEPGSHVDLHLSNGLVRSYSLCGGHSGRYRLGIQKDRASRGGSLYVHDELRVGAVLEISSPRNNFPLHEDATHSVFIAGGIGITPILSMLRRMQGLGRSVELIYAARARDEVAFASEIERLGIPVLWHINDEQGGPPDLESLLRGRAPDAHYYACGPSAMLDSFEALCAKLNRPNWHIERFAVQPRDDPPQADYTVRLARSGLKLDVRNDRSLLDVLLDAGMDVPYSCREGTCGTCKTAVLQGQPRHRDAVLTAQERASGTLITPCVSGCAGSELVLDL
ncbi:MAG TPA: PDR/VanB family oxidoreductase [Bordetella sp.]|nr:PDR/VanB family oxidoreductase [Bordetella sp.]